MTTLSAEQEQCECRPLTPELDTETRAIWHSVLALVPDTPIFAFPEWLECAVRCGVLRNVQLLIVREREIPIAVIPIHQTVPGKWSVAAPFSMTGAAIIVSPTRSAQTCAGVGAWLRTQASPGLLTLHGCSLLHDTLADTLHAQELALRRQSLPASQLVPLAESWEAFVQGRGRSTRRKLHTLHTRLHEGIPGITVELITHEDEVDDAMSALIHLYRQRWADQVGGSPLCPSCNAAFLHQTMRWVVRQGYGVIPVIRYHGHPIALGTVLALPGQSTAYYQFTARDTTHDVPALAHSVGTALSIIVVEWAIAHGYTQLNMGHGNTRYKQALGGEPVPNWQLTIASSPFAHAILPPFHRVLHIMSRLPVHLDYHLRRLFRQAPPRGEADE
jgi:CelD/BcsL family acetyltransferase involved in cellulose biosynthesis